MSLELRQVAEECERRAAEFREKAQDTSSCSNSQYFLELEQHWLHLACIYYQTHAALRALEQNSDATATGPWNVSSSSIH
jgi:hypothetical protein